MARRVSCDRGLSALGVVCGAPDRDGCFRPVAGCRARSASSVVVKDFAQGQSVGKAQGWSSGAVDETAGECEESGADRAVATSWLSTRTRPMVAVQRIML